MTEQTYDVVIVGGGPVGMGLAIDLGQRGRSVAVVERYPEPQPIPKGQNLTQRTMENVAAWGCASELRAARVTPRDVANGGLVTYGTLLSDYAYDWLPRERVRPYYAEEVERLPQYATERVLRARAAEVPGVTCFYGWEFASYAEDDDGVHVGITQAKGEESRVLRAAYAVGCDGARSALREAAGITQTRRDHDKRMVLLVFRSPELHEMLGARYDAKAFYNALSPDLDGYWLFLGRVDLGTEWFFHAPVPADTTADNFDFAAYLHRAVGERFPLDISYIGFWDLRIAIADSYRKGRALIAGDAAHSHPPYGGYGINTGFEDARNLGWKLSGVLQGWAGAGLLDSYDAERRPVFASTAADFIERFIREDREFLAQYAPERDRAAFEAAWTARNAGATEVMAFEPNYEGSPVVWSSGGCPSARGTHVFTARAGHHLAPQRLADGRSVASAMGRGFTLLTDDAAIGAIFAGAAEASGVPLDVVASLSAEAVAAYGARAVLVRPDGFVAWAGDEVAEAATVLARAAGVRP
jgi:2-polyprenyl-6-methoxyphenol hydroxylase-like FAD-dependent oxidoreductase